MCAYICLWLGLLPNNFGTRNLSDNISDLRAQVIAYVALCEVCLSLCRCFDCFVGVRCVVCYDVQVAANHRGVALVNELVREYGFEVVCAYMQVYIVL